MEDMDWKILLKATGLISALFAIITGIIILGKYYPVILLGIIFLGSIALCYCSMKEHED